MYDEMVTFENLEDAYKKAKRQKSRKYSVLNFNQYLYSNLELLFTELHTETYNPKPANVFEVKEKDKIRKISALQFSDLIVQHLIYKQISPIFESTFSDYSYACRKGKGCHRAAIQTFNYYKNYQYYLKIDIKKYFHNVNIEILFSLLQRKIKCEKTLNLIRKYYKNEVGIPIGYLLSQLFANVYLNQLDLFLHHQIKLKFVRYMDDVVIFSNDKDELRNIKEKIENFIIQKLNLSFSKWHIHKTTEKLNAYGYVFSNKKIFLRKTAIKTIKKKIKKGTLHEMNGHTRFASRGEFNNLIENINQLNRNMKEF